MMKKTAKVTRQVIGWILVVIGFFGLALPLLQGVLLLVIGFYVLSLDSKWFQEKLDEWLAKDVRAAELFKKVDRNIKNFFGMRENHDI